MKFYVYDGDLIGLPTNLNHVVVRWDVPDVKVLFSFTQKGDYVLSCHYASQGATFEQTNQAIRDFIEFVAEVMPNIEKLAAVVKLPKVASRIAKLGFKLAGTVVHKHTKYLVYEYEMKGEN